ncbi:MAG: hypothetical protein MUP58_02810 [Candidatus Nanohaloarchaeota archaeon QJJ-9]|nr:hypothetical protein [Candidatus Nanohaloarchaeota archaeon QJJ-9]
MPHRCLNCGREYEKGDEELLEGCECGSTLFIFEKKPGEKDEEKLKDTKETVMEEIDNYLSSIKNNEEGAGDTNIRFDLQSIRVLEEGVYEIDLKKLLDNVPLIVEVKESSYYLHLPSVFTEGDEKSLSLKELAGIED